MTKDTISEILAGLRHEYECRLENDAATDVVCDCQLKDLESKLTSLVEEVREDEPQLHCVVRRAEAGEFGNDEVVIRISAVGHSLSRFSKRGEIKNILEEMVKDADTYEKMFTELENLSTHKEKK